MLLFVFITGTLSYIFYKWATLNENYFQKRNINYMQQKSLNGNTLGLFWRRYTPAEFFDSIYHRFSKEKYVHFKVNFSVKIRENFVIKFHKVNWILSYAGASIFSP